MSPSSTDRSCCMAAWTPVPANGGTSTKVMGSRQRQFASPLAAAGAPCWTAAVPQPGWARFSCSKLVEAWLTISLGYVTHFYCRVAREFPYQKQTPAGFLPRLDYDFSLYILLVCLLSLLAWQLCLWKLPSFHLRLPTLKSAWMDMIQ